MADLQLDTQAEPSVPASGSAIIYVDSADRNLTVKDEKGIILKPVRSSLPNWIRNSGFWFAQRQNPTSLTTYSSPTARLICADGWGLTCENASSQYIRTDTAGAVEAGLQGQYYGNFTKITSTGKLVVTQVIEGRDTLALRGRTVRVQFWAKQLVGVTPKLRLCLVQLNTSGTIDSLPATYISALGANSTDPTLGTNLAYIAPKSAAGLVADGGTINGNGVDCTLAAGWQRYGAVFDVPSNCKNLIVQIHGDSQFAATNGFALGQVSLTDGYEIQNWSPLSAQIELERVIRFYQKTFNIDTVPNNNTGSGTGELRWILCIAGAVASSQWWAFLQRMIKAPVTVIFYNPAAANSFARNFTKGTDATATTVTIGQETGLQINPTGLAAWVLGDIMQCHITADAEL